MRLVANQSPTNFRKNFQVNRAEDDRVDDRVTIHKNVAEGDNLAEEFRLFGTVSKVMP